MFNAERLLKILGLKGFFKPASQKKLQKALKEFVRLMSGYGYFSTTNNIPGDVYIATLKKKTGTEQCYTDGYKKYLQESVTANDGIEFDEGAISLVGLVFLKPDSIDNCLVVEMRFPDNIALPRNKKEWPCMPPNAMYLVDFLLMAKTETPHEIFDRRSWARQLAEGGVPRKLQCLKGRMIFEEPRIKVRFNSLSQ